MKQRDNLKFSINEYLIENVSIWKKARKPSTQSVVDVSPQDDQRSWIRKWMSI